MENAQGTRAGIALLLVAMVCLTLNDMIVKQLSGSYPVHQIVFARSLIGLAICLMFLVRFGSPSGLAQKYPGLHVLRCLFAVLANIAFFAGLAVLPLADATALFYIAPVFITLLSAGILHERLGVWRLLAVAAGFIGVLLIFRPGGVELAIPDSRWVLLLPVSAALAYASVQILTRRLSGSADAFVMTIYVQGAFLATSLMFWFVAGDGRFADGFESESARFLLRAWVWPDGSDLILFVVIGGLSAGFIYALTKAYLCAAASILAPFEYSAIPLAVLWGWLGFSHLPDPWSIAGIVLIAVSGLLVCRSERSLPRAGRDSQNPGASPARSSTKRDTH